MKNLLKNKSVELTIGQYLLNRLGVLSLVAGFAFFIAYSFQFIGPFGKLLLGFGASALLLFLGKQLEKKEDMRWYGFGLIGGGWSLAYFTTYAMHHIPSVQIIQSPHYALLALVLVTSVLMIDLLKYKSQSITTIVFLLGFFTAGVERVTYFSLVYAALLTASMIFVVYKMQWNRLLLVALVASYATHLFWLGPEIFSPEASRFLLTAGFLTLYGIIFFVSPLLIALNTDEDKKIQTSTVLLNAFFYVVLMFHEAGKWNPELKFWISLGTGIFCIVTSCLSKYIYKRDHLVIANMTLAITLITISFPLKFIDRWVYVAWLIEIPMLVFLGLYFKRFLYRAFAWGLGFVMSLKLLAMYGAKSAVAAIIWNGIAVHERSMIAWVGVFAFCAVTLIYQLYRKNEDFREGEVAVSRTFYIGALFLIGYLSLFDTQANWISISWAVMAALFFVAGFLLKDRWFRYSALTLVAMVVLRVVAVDIRDLPSIFRIALFIGMGLALLLASFVYGKIAITQKEEISHDKNPENG